jgi:hypothetical protein
VGYAGATPSRSAIKALNPHREVASPAIAADN